MIYLHPTLKKMKETNIVKYDKELTLVLGGGGNSGILISDSLVIVINTKMDDGAQQLYKMVKEQAGNKPVLVINTNFHPDNCGGNMYYKGQTIIAGGNYTEKLWKNEAGEENLPTKWLKDKMDIKVGDDTVTIFNFAKTINTVSDVVVYFHKRKILFAGDIILNKQVPVLTENSDPDAYISAFDSLPKQFDIEKIVPGHGAIGGLELIDNFRQYFIDMKTAATDDSKKDELVAKYKDWVQLPFFMSPDATINAIKKKLWP